MKYHAPLDPECPEWNAQVSSLMDDPMTHAMGAPTDDIIEGWEPKHRAKCERCMNYGLANIEVV